AGGSYGGDSAGSIHGANRQVLSVRELELIAERAGKRPDHMSRCVQRDRTVERACEKVRRGNGCSNAWRISYVRGCAQQHTCVRKINRPVECNCPCKTTYGRRAEVAVPARIHLQCASTAVRDAAGRADVDESVREESKRVRRRKIARWTDDVYTAAPAGAYARVRRGDIDVCASQGSGDRPPSH